MLKYGFFDSIKGDRKYNSKDVAELFDGIIVDGIYAQLYERFSVNIKSVIETPEDRMTITVGTGQAWLSHTKVLNTSKMEFILSEAVGMNRYDALIIEVNDNNRIADIFVKPNVKTKTDDPSTSFDLIPGQLVNTEFVHQYLLAVILVEGGAGKIKSDNIASKIGFALPDGIPYVTCPLEPFPADETLKQWVSQWYTFLNGSDAAFKTAQQDRAVQFDNFMSESNSAFTTAQNNRAAAFTADQNARTTDYQALRQSIIDWLNSTQTDWNTWYASVKDDLEGYFVGKIEDHNVSTDAHEDIRTLIQNLTTKLDTVADSDDETLDQLSEIVAFVKENRETIQFLNGIAEGVVLNSKTKPGYVASGGTNANKAWMTDANGNPGWRGVLPDTGFDNFAGISCLGSRAFTLWVNGQTGIMTNGFTILNNGMILNGNFLCNSLDGTSGHGVYIRNDTGYAINFYAMVKIHNATNSNPFNIQYGRGNNNGSLPTYQTTGANRVAFEVLSATDADWKTISYTVPNSQTFYFSVGPLADLRIRWIGADPNYYITPLPISVGGTEANNKVDAWKNLATGAGLVIPNGNWSENFRDLIGIRVDDSFVRVLRNSANGGVGISQSHSSVLCFGCGDVQGCINIDNGLNDPNDPKVFVSGGSGNFLRWTRQLAFKDGVPQNLYDVKDQNFYMSTNSKVDIFVQAGFGSEISSKGMKLLFVKSVSKTNIDTYYCGAYLLFGLTIDGDPEYTHSYPKAIKLGSEGTEANFISIVGAKNSIGIPYITITNQNGCFTNGVVYSLTLGTF